MISILLVDDHQLMREGIKQFLSHLTECQVIAEAATGEEALLLINDYKPNIVLLDLNLPGLSGIPLIEQIAQQFPQSKVLVLSMHNEIAIVKQAIKAGAKGYIKKDSAPQDLVNAIQSVANDGRYISQDIMEKIIFEDIAGASESTRISLTGQELKVLKLIAKGERGKSIAALLGLSEKTISAHKANIKNKLNAKSDIDLIEYAKRMDLINEVP